MKNDQVLHTLEYFCANGMPSRRTRMNKFLRRMKFLNVFFIITHHSLLDLVVDRDCTGTRRTIKTQKIEEKMEN